MTNAQHDTDKMREEFKKWWIGSKYRQVIVADEFIESAAFDGWQASADKSSATIARLEERAAAAEADNVRLREAGEAAMRLDYFREHNALARMMQEALAHPLSASALDAHVAKVTAALREELAAKNASIESQDRAYRELQAKVDALVTQGGALTIADRLENDPEYLRKVAGAPVDIITASCAPDNQKG